MDFYEKWLYIIRNCNFDNTYKMAWAKAITELSLDYDFEDSSENKVELRLENIARKVIKYYWEQTIYFNLQQSPNQVKPPVIISVVRKLIEAYQNETSSYMPLKWIKADVEGLCPSQYEDSIKRITKALKADVSYRFLKVAGEEIEGIYDYNKKDDSLYIDRVNFKQLKENSATVFESINYRWAQMLEGFNHSPRICKKVRIIDEASIKRKPLGRFSVYLDADNQDNLCFICDQEIHNEKPAMDHVIPWSYLYSDDIWNLVYTHQACNSRKSNIIPREEMIQKLEQRNEKLLGELQKNKKKDKQVSELQMAIENNLVRKFWISCQG